MLRRKERTLDTYMRAGASMRLFRTLGSKLVNDISKVLSASDQDMLVRLMLKIDRICSRAEDNMFCDYPELSNNYLDVFYGCTNIEPRSDVDIKIMEMVKEMTGTLVWNEAVPGRLSH